MKKHINFAGLLVLLAFVSFGMSGCKEEGCTDPLAINYDELAEKDDGSCILPSELEFHLHSNFGADDFNYGTDYTLASGRKVNLSIARFYVSNIRLMNGTAETALPDVYRQYTPGTDHFKLGTVNAGSYTSVKFDIGIDSTSNFSDPSAWADDHSLSSSSATHDHWSWNSGYVFMKVEGRVDTSAAMNGPTDMSFVYHVGTMNFLRTVELPVNFTVPEAGDAQVHLAVDVEQFFDGIDMTSQFDTHTMNDMPLANTVANNIQAAISVQ